MHELIFEIIYIKRKYEGKMQINLINFIKYGFIIISYIVVVHIYNIFPIGDINKTKLNNQ